MTYTIITAIRWVFGFMELAILARAVLSWLPIPKDGPFFRLLYQITEPILAPVRGLIERAAMGRYMMIDFSPIVALLLIRLISSILQNLVFWLL